MRYIFCVYFFLLSIQKNFHWFLLGNCFTVTRGKKKKKRKAFAKLALAGTLIKAKIELLLKILGAHLQIKFFAIALIGLLINIARFWIDVKRGGTPSKVSWRLPDETNVFTLFFCSLEHTQGWKTKQCSLLFYHTTTINDSSAPIFSQKYDMCIIYVKIVTNLKSSKCLRQTVVCRHPYYLSVSFPPPLCLF